MKSYKTLTIDDTRPSWWDSYRESVESSKAALGNYRLGLSHLSACKQTQPAPQHSKPEQPLRNLYPKSFTAPGLVKCRTRTERNQMNEYLKETQVAVAQYGVIASSLGRGYFSLVDASAKPWERRHQLLKSTDQKTSRIQKLPAVLSRASACRSHLAPLIFELPETHINYDSEPQTYRPRIFKPIGPIGEPIKICRHAPGLPDRTEAIDGCRVTDTMHTLIDVLGYFKAPDFIAPADYLLRKSLELHPLQRDIPDDALEIFEENLKTALQEYRTKINHKKVLRRFRMLSPLAESPLESLARFMLMEMGLPNARVQFPIPYSPSAAVVIDPSEGALLRYGDFSTAYVDMAWPEFGLAIEIDGFSKYSSETDLRAEKHRENVVRQVFPKLVRLTWQSLKDWDSLARLMASILR